MFDRSALEPVPRRLWSIFLPQLDQLGATPMRTRAGVGARIDGELAQGWCWGTAIAPDCLVLSLHVRVRKDFQMREAPEHDHLALSMMTTSDVESLGPQTLPHAFLPVRDEAVFLMPVSAGDHTFDLHTGGTHGGASVCMLPSFVEQASSRLDPHERDALLAACEKPLDLTDDVALRAALRDLAPADAGRPGADALYAARAHEALALAAMSVLEADAGAGGPRVDSLAAQVDALLRRSLTQPPTLGQLAARLYISRTQLCQRFHAEAGMSVGQRLAQIRVEEAQVLLAHGRSVRDVARAVGFAHQSSFDAAFKRVCGVTPTAWQKTSK